MRPCMGPGVARRQHAGMRLARVNMLARSALCACWECGVAKVTGAAACGLPASHVVMSTTAARRAVLLL